MENPPWMKMYFYSRCGFSSLLCLLTGGYPILYERSKTVSFSILPGTKDWCEFSRMGQGQLGFFWCGPSLMWNKLSREIAWWMFFLSMKWVEVWVHLTLWRSCRTGLSPMFQTVWIWNDVFATFYWIIPSGKATSSWKVVFSMEEWEVILQR